MLIATNIFAQQTTPRWMPEDEFDYRVFTGPNISPLIHLSCEIQREIVYRGRVISWRVVNLSSEPIRVSIEVEYTKSCGGDAIIGPAIKNRKPIEPGIENAPRDDIRGTDLSRLGTGFRKNIKACDDSVELKDIRILSCTVSKIGDIEPEEPPIRNESVILPDTSGPKIDLELFKEKAFQKIRDLNNKITRLSDANTGESQANRIIDESVELFVNDQSLVQVSTVADIGKKKSFPIREYLIRVKQLPYTKVIVEWTRIQIVTDFVLQPDSSYIAVAQFEQSFQGLVDEQVVYSDITEKRVTVHVKMRKAYKGLQLMPIWEVFLGDIGVVQTRKG